MKTPIDRHNEMVFKLSNEIGPDVGWWHELLDLFKQSPLSTVEIPGIKNVQCFFSILMNSTLIEYGQYGYVINKLQSPEALNHYGHLVKIMEECQQDIEKMKNENAAGPTNDGNPSSLGPDRQKREMKKNDETLYESKKRKNANADGFPSDSYPTSYAEREDTEKRGLMVIFNFSTFKEKNKSRPHASVDQKTLKRFFEDDLKWDVRYHVDCSKAEVKQRLNETQTILKNDKENKYYCLFVVVMSHGQEMSFRTYDWEPFNYQDVFSEFTSTTLPEFAGRPKVFLMQSCKGGEIQREILSDDVNSDSASDTCPILDDSDFLVLWATTPGCKAFADEDDGSFLIEVTVTLFKEKYASDDHDVEWMLTDIRRKIAYDSKYRSASDGSQPYRQMPCTWSTLTDKLYIIKHLEEPVTQ